MNRRHVLAGSGAMALCGSRIATASDGFFVPPEEAPHERTFMQWPVNRQVHPDPVFLEMAQQSIADIANAIAEFEPVVMLAAASDHARAQRKLSAAVDLWDGGIHCATQQMPKA